MVFLVLNSVSDETFAGAPGSQTLLLFLCALAAARPAEAGLCDLESGGFNPQISTGRGRL
jgi:hypothetical protein